MTSPFDVSGRRALVTGANAGIGQGIAVALAEAGAEIIGVGRSPMDETEKLVAAAGSRLSSVEIDLAQPKAAAQMIGDVWEMTGPLDILVNNAGTIRRAWAESYTDEDWDTVMGINVKAPFVLSREFGRRVLAEERRGKIVNIASVLAFQGGIQIAAYPASKHALSGLTKLLANEWAARGINVNAVAPGYVKTRNTEDLWNDPKRRADLNARIPAGRWGEPIDIGRAVVFLASPAADYVHGVTLPVDGGWLAR